MSVRRRAVVGLGANLGQRERTLGRAVTALERAAGVVLTRRSRWIETHSVGGAPGAPRFLNGVVFLETTLEARELLEQLIAIEDRLGRTRDPAARNAARVIDLDLLWMEGTTLTEPDLEVPHPRLEERSFVLAPLAELAPEFELPSGVTAAARLAVLLDEQAAWLELRRAPLEAAAWLEAVRAQDATTTVGFVPTMGALHAGHLALWERALQENDVAVASVFVNPLQFEDPADLACYPRDLEGDVRLLAEVACEVARARGAERKPVGLVFSGELSGFFPGELDERGSLPPSSFADAGPAAAGLEGEHRAGHFAGVATIVRRLFELTRPSRAYFGRKDYQQCRVVQHVAEVLAREAPAGDDGVLAPEVVVCRTIREDGGLALSSRNVRLSEDGRRRALVLPAALRGARASWVAGERDAGRLTATLRAPFDDAEGVELEYAELREEDSWAEAAPEGELVRPVALVAARVESVRLIDNLPLAGGLDELSG